MAVIMMIVLFFPLFLSLSFLPSFLSFPLLLSLPLLSKWKRKKKMTDSSFDPNNGLEKKSEREAREKREIVREGKKETGRELHLQMTREDIIKRWADVITSTLLLPSLSDTLIDTNSGSKR